MSRRVRRILIAAIAALALAGLIGVHFAPGSAGRLEARLQAAAERALTAREHRWAGVRVSGQTATVSGQAPSERRGWTRWPRCAAPPGPAGRWPAG
ncbi:MAG: hypothetical protein KIS81_10865 [Maricaulaceae bacterium]|nr:hypothetical protein [Maricaulaceae bacterium]